MSNFVSFIFFSLLIAGLAGCSSPALDSKDDPAPQSLFEDTAMERSEIVSNVHYILKVELFKEDRPFIGEVTMKFDLKEETGDPLRIDFNKGDVQQVEVNGIITRNYSYNNHYILVADSLFKKGPNKVVVSYTHPYSKTGAGLYRFKDPEDGRVYIYSDFEPYDANRLFPHFDQPDLKATYTLEVTAPSHWTIVSSTSEEKVETRGKKKTWKFETSARFSSYIFSLIAGPWKIWESRYKKIPLRLMSRQSMAKYIPADEWFKITKQGFEFFDNYFDYPYPYKKYDQIIVPDFNAGAMENVAAVTYREGYFPKGKPTRQQRMKRSNTLLHEMAHMWFGNLVTMKWWNGLWLNESFATFMANKALFEATEFNDNWLAFYNGTKNWAYWTDQLVTTHPIEVPVEDTENAFANFDGITYGKGASVLKQLDYFLGPEKFRQGMRDYFRKYAEQNTVLKDFIGSLEDASQIDLEDWTREWLMKAGLNTVEAFWSCENGKVNSFKLLQTAPNDHSTLRTHRTIVAFFKKDSRGDLKISREQPVTYSGEETVVENLTGEKCPDLVFTNYKDHDYVKVKLDRKSLAAAKSSLRNVANTLTRSMLWSSLWDMLRDGQLPLDEYKDLVIANIASEKNDELLQAVLGNVTGRWENSDSLRSYYRATPEQFEKSQRSLEELEGFFWKNLKLTKAASDKQKIWFDGLVKMATTRPMIKKLSDMLEGRGLPSGFELDQDRRWAIIYRVNYFDSLLGEKLVVAELINDKSLSGKKAAIAARAVRGDENLKDELYKKLVDPSSKMSLAELKTIMWNLFPPGQNSLKSALEAGFYKDIVKIGKERDVEFAETFASSMVPTRCTPQSAARLEEFLDDASDLGPLVRKELRIALQEEKRCLNIIN